MSVPERRASRWRGWLLVAGVFGAWIALQQVLHPDAGAPVVCERDRDPGAASVVMLSASWCGYCRRARAWFKAEGIDYCEYDVETSAEGRARFARLPLKVVPAIHIRDDVLIGFNKTEIEQTLIAHGLAELP